MTTQARLAAAYFASFHASKAIEAEQMAKVAVSNPFRQLCEYKQQYELNQFDMFLKFI